MSGVVGVVVVVVVDVARVRRAALGATNWLRHDRQTQLVLARMPAACHLKVRRAEAVRRTSMGTVGSPGRRSLVVRLLAVPRRNGRKKSFPKSEAAEAARLWWRYVPDVVRGRRDQPRSRAVRKVPEFI